MKYLIETHNIKATIIRTHFKTIIDLSLKVDGEWQHQDLLYSLKEFKKIWLDSKK